MVLLNRAKHNTSTTGTGTVTLGSAVVGFQTFAAAGAADNDVISYVIEDGVDFEYGRGTYTASGTTLSRDTVLGSSNGGAAISLSGSATVFSAALAEDVAVLGNDQTWQDMTTSRAKSTVYQNNTGRPILVSIRSDSRFGVGSGAGGDFQVSSDGSAFTTIGWAVEDDGDSAGVRSAAQGPFEVRDGEFYQFVPASASAGSGGSGSGDFTTWMERR